MTQLSPRETELYGYLLQDIRMKEIAALMGIDPTTADTYAVSLYRKKGVQSRIGLIIQFYTHNTGTFATDKSLVDIVNLKKIDG